MKTYDFIFAGSGLAGLSLAYALARSSMAGRSMLLIDPEPQPKNHTLSFWADHPGPFETIIQHRWERLAVQSSDCRQVLSLGNYRYQTLWLKDLDAFVRRELAAHKAIECLSGRVEGIVDTADGVKVSVGGEVVGAKWLFDSRPLEAEASIKQKGVVDLHQHFKGWQIETEEPVFDPQVATLFDFRLPQKGELRFCYVLPFSPNHALVEFVLFSPENYDKHLGNFIENQLGIRNYRVLSTEGGITLLSTGSFPRRASAHVLNIGLRGGQAKPSSGYAFTRIQQDSAAIVRSLQVDGHPFNIPRGNKIYRFCDATLLRMMQQNGEWIAPVYMQMFQRNTAERVFRFLDETISLPELLAFSASLPLGYFGKALLQTAFAYLG